MKQISTEVKGLLEKIEELPIDDKRVVLASIRGMLLVTDANKNEREEIA